MRGWNSKKWNFWNKVLAGACIVVAAALAVFLIWCRNGERTRVEQIARGVESTSAMTAENSQEEGQQTAASDGDAQNAEAVSETGTEEIDGNTGETTAGDGADIDTGDTLTVISGISWRGDEFLSGEDIGTKNAPALLAQRLQEEGYQVPVENLSLTGAGTLSQMRLAGVEERQIQWYVEQHTQENDGEASQMETGVREFSQEELERTDQTYLPVIFMGYYGGWSNDPEELAEQIQLILDTYENPDQYLVLGLHPISGGVNPEGYQQVMEDTWGEHYIDLPEVLDGSTAASYDGQEKIADAVFDQLNTLGYLA